MPTLKGMLLSAVAASAVTVAMGAAAHTTVMPKNTPEGWGERKELEGTTSFGQIAIGHGCAASDSSEYQPVTAMSVVWPNGFYAETVRQDNGESVNLADEIAGNAVMSPTPVQDHDVFGKIEVVEAEVPPFNSHGVQTSDVRAFHYRDGRLETYMLGLIPYRITSPTFLPESCAYEMRVNFAIANYCSRSREDEDRADIWMGMLTEKFSDPAVVSVGSWPSFTVVRDLENNPLPESCEGGYAITVSPSASSLDQFLPARGYWPSEPGKGLGNGWWK